MNDLQTSVSKRHLGKIKPSRVHASQVDMENGEEAWVDCIVNNNWRIRRDIIQ